MAPIPTTVKTSMDWRWSWPKRSLASSVAFNVSEGALEDAMAEYDELTVEGLLREIIDKAIACDEITCKVEEGPNTLEELDALKGA